MSRTFPDTVTDYIFKSWDKISLPSVAKGCHGVGRKFNQFILYLPHTLVIESNFLLQGLLEDRSLQVSGRTAQLC